MRIPGRHEFLARVTVRFRLPPPAEIKLEAGFGGIKWDKWDSVAQDRPRPSRPRLKGRGRARQRRARGIWDHACVAQRRAGGTSSRPPARSTCRGPLVLALRRADTRAKAGCAGTRAKAGCAGTRAKAGCAGTRAKAGCAGTRAKAGCAGTRAKASESRVRGYARGSKVRGYARGSRVRGYARGKMIDPSRNSGAHAAHLASHHGPGIREGRGPDRDETGGLAASRRSP